jgi:hypothetical protein
MPGQSGTWPDETRSLFLLVLRIRSGGRAGELPRPRVGLFQKSAQPQSIRPRRPSPKLTPILRSSLPVVSQVRGSQIFSPKVGRLRGNGEAGGRNAECRLQTDASSVRWVAPAYVAAHFNTLNRGAHPPSERSSADQIEERLSPNRSEP